MNSNQNDEDRKQPAAISHPNLQTIINSTKNDSDVDSDEKCFTMKATVNGWELSNDTKAWEHDWPNEYLKIKIWSYQHEQNLNLD